MKKNYSRNKTASMLVAFARQIMANEEQDSEQDDPKMTEKLRTLKTQITKLNPKRNRTLKQMGVGSPIKTTTKVEELIDMLTTMTTT